MTDTTITPEDTTAAPPAGGELQHVDPNTLIIGDNVRDDAALDRDFVNSITTHGVLLPITAVRDDANQLIVRDGQRRCRAAQSAGLTTVPVYVLPSEATNLREFTVERLVQQISLNDQRTDLTEAQSARGIQQILDTGISVTKAVHHNIGALRGQRFGQTQANAAGGAGNEGGFAFEHGGDP